LIAIWRLFGGAMATVFRRPKRLSFDAKIKIWDAAKNREVWKNISTGMQDEKKALALATSLEVASGQARVGVWTKAKAEALVSSILALAGVEWHSSPPFGELIEKFIESKSKGISAGSREMYLAKWRSFSKWAGPRVNQPAEKWRVEDLQAYYDHLCTRMGVTSAGQHLDYMATFFRRAEEGGHIKGNPAKLVLRAPVDVRTERLPFDRKEAAAIIKGFRADPHWQTLAALGWHTGARVSDALDFTVDHLSEVEGVGWVLRFQPKKKTDVTGRAKGGSRQVILPIPRYLALRLKRLGSLAPHLSGAVTARHFVQRMQAAGVDPMFVQHKKNLVPRKSFHSFRHAMTSRLVAAGVQGETARLVTDHETVSMHKRYTHAEVKSIAEALKKARRV
jgi:integrase